MYHEWDNAYAVSVEAEPRCANAIYKWFGKKHVSTVTKAALVDDKTGVDYWVGLNNGKRVGIDHKARAAGCSRYWQDSTHPELAIETWSVIPADGTPGKVGWPIDHKKKTDYVVFTFDPQDSIYCFVFPFLDFQRVCEMNLYSWTNLCSVKKQQSNSWWSECVFVQVRKVLDAMGEGPCVLVDGE